MKLKLSLMAMLLIFMFLSCQKDTNGPSGINYKMKTTNRTATAGRAEGTITWTSGHASATEIEFEAERQDSEIELKSGTQQRIDIFSPLSSLGFIAVPPGTYEEVEFEVHLAPNPPDAALELRGNYNGTPIIFTINTPLEIEAEFENVTITQNNDFTAIINLNLARLSQGITDAALSAATLTNGEIVISATSNVALYNIMIANISEIDEVEFEDD